jgi:hypothetical protein
VPTTQPQARGRSRQQRQQHTQQDQRSGRLRARQRPSLPPNGAIISVELSSGSEPDTPAAHPQVCHGRDLVCIGVVCVRKCCHNVSQSCDVVQTGDKLWVAVAWQAAMRRQQPKRGRSVSAVPAEDAHASQSTGSGKRQQLSPPSDGRQQTPSPGEGQPGPRLLRSTSRSAASAPLPAGRDSTSVAAQAAGKAGGRTPAEGSAAGSQLSLGRCT